MSIEVFPQTDVLHGKFHKKNLINCVYRIINQWATNATKVSTIVG